MIFTTILDALNWLSLTYTLHMTLLFAREEISFVNAMHQYFTHFSEASGLQANLGKSYVYFRGVSQAERAQIIQQLGFSYGELPLNT